MSEAVTTESAKVWLAGEDIYETMRSLVGRYHPDLALVVDAIEILFKEKSSKKGDVMVHGQTSKASPQLRAIARKDVIFVITLSAEYWEELSDVQRVAYIDHHLHACRVEEKDGGSFKYYISPPEMSFYREELEKYGAWRTTGGTIPMDVLGTIFGPDEV